MATEFETIEASEDNRVPVHFDEGHAGVTLRLSATKDFDGSHRLIYDAAEGTRQPETYSGGSGTCYDAGADTLVRIEPAKESRAGTT